MLLRNSGLVVKKSICKDPFYPSMTNRCGMRCFMVQYIALAGTSNCELSRELAKKTQFERHGAYLSHIAARLAHSGQELQCSHPFFRTQSCLPSEVMEMRDQPVEEVSETKI